MWLATQKHGYMLRSRTSGIFRTCPPKGRFRGEAPIDLPICPPKGRFCGETSVNLLVCPQNRGFRGESSSESSSETSIGLAVGCRGIKKEPTENQ